MAFLEDLTKILLSGKTMSQKDYLYLRFRHDARYNKVQNSVPNVKPPVLPSTPSGVL